MCIEMFRNLLDFINFYKRRSHAPVPVVQEAGWASVLVWTGVGSRKYLAPSWVLNPNHPARKRVAIPTELSRSPFHGIHTEICVHSAWC
jgi:hypothetical protein